MQLTVASDGSCVFQKGSIIQEIDFVKRVGAKGGMLPTGKQQNRPLVKVFAVRGPLEEGVEQHFLP